MAESSSSAVPALPGLAVEVAEWLPSGAESGLVRVRGRWTDDAAREAELPGLALRAAGREHRFDSLPDVRFSRDPSSWRGTYLVAAELVASGPEALWLEWPSGARSGLPALARGVEPPAVPATRERPDEPEAGGQVIDRAVLAERRARRAEAAEQASTRRAAEALKAVEVLELRSAELERRLEEATAERDALAAAPPGQGEALAAALASASDLRSRAREWQLRMRATEVARTSDAVRLAVVEAERAAGADRSALAAVEAERTAGADRSALAAAQAELNSARAELAAASAAAVEIERSREASEARFAEARAAWERRREELETALAGVRTELEAAREQVAAHAAEAEDLRRRSAGERAVQEEVRTALKRALAEARDGETELRGRVVELEAALAVAEGRLQTAEVALAAAESRLRVETVARSTLEDELDRERAARGAELAAAGDLRSELEAERTARARAEADAERAGASLQERIAELERGAAPDLERVAREHGAAAAARPAAEPAGRLLADLDAAADALRRRTAPLAEQPDEDVEEAPDAPGEPDGPVASADPPDETDEPPRDADDASDEPEPAAPDAELGIQWAGTGDEDARSRPSPAVEPVRPDAGSPDRAVEWAPPIAEPEEAETVEPPAPDAEPSVEWGAGAPPEDAAPPEPPAAPEPPTPAEPQDAAEPEPPVAAASPVAAAPPAPEPPAPPKATGPRIVPASKPPARALVVGSTKRAYPMLRGAIVKLAHDDPAAAGRLLAALLPAQSALLDAALSYDLTVTGTGTFGVDVVGSRTYVERLDRPRPRAKADFHLTGDPLALAELLAGVDHRIRRFFGPLRARGRRRQLKRLWVLPAGAISLTDAARAGAALDPELVYRTLAYAVHPSWTRGHAFTVAQAVTGEPAQTWFVTARDGAGLSVSSSLPGAEPDATVSMSRPAFDRLLRGEPVPRGERPSVRGDREAVELLRAWTLRAQG